jgi:hypothetical protein
MAIHKISYAAYRNSNYRNKRNNRENNELLEINQQVQGQIILYLLIELIKLETEIDVQLTEISQLLQEIISSRNKEAETLDKIK